MGISFGSINTGLPKDIVQKIMEAEKIPITRMEEKKEKITAKSALVGELAELLGALRTTAIENVSSKDLRELKVDTDESIIGVSLDKNTARPGDYRIEVVQLAQKSSAMTSAFEDPDESYTGVGFVQYHLPNGDSREIYIDSDNASLNGIAKVINMDDSNGLRANVINDGSGDEKPWRLTLSLTETGDGAKAEFPYFYFIDGEEDLFLEFEREAHNAIVSLDGFEVEIPDNKTTELVPGATIDLKRAKPGEEFSLSIKEDEEAISGKITGFVEKVNAVLAFIKQQNSLDQNTDTSRTLGGDILLQSLESRLRGVIFKPIETDFGFRRLGDLGIKFQRNGMLEFSEKEFNNMVASDFNMVAQLLTGSVTAEGQQIDGFLDNLKSMTDLALRSPDGLVTSRKRTLKSNTRQIDKRIADKERMLKRKEENLKQKFSRLESTISRLKNQSAGLAGMAGQVASPVQQLG